MTTFSLRDVIAASQQRPVRPFMGRLTRPPGTYLAWLLLRLGCGPTGVSFFHFGLAMTACGLFAVVHAEARPLVALLVLLWQILDNSDGTMARILKSCSKFGGYIDEIAGLFLLAFLPIGIAIGLYFHPEPVAGGALFGVSAIPPELVLVCGALTSVAACMYRLMLRMVQIQFGENIGGDEDAQLTTSGPTARLMLFVKDLENLGGYQILILIVAAFLHRLDYYIVFYFFLEMAILIALTVKICISGRLHKA